VDETIFGWQHLAVFNLNAPFVMGWDGEYVGLDGTRSDVFEQSRVTQLADNLVINLAGFVGLQDFSFDGVAVDPHGQLGNGRAFR
jgi:hypothetical protein